MLLLAIFCLTSISLIVNHLLENPPPTFFQFTGKMILNVPFVKQKPWFCSEASASMVLKYYGINLSQDEIHALGYECFEDMLPLLRSFLNCSYRELDLEGVKKEIDEGDPIIARLKVNGFLHTVVIVGYEGKFIVVHDPAIGPYVRCEIRDFLSKWTYTNFIAIVFD